MQDMETAEGGKVVEMDVDAASQQSGTSSSSASTPVTQPANDQEDDRQPGSQSLSERVKRYIEAKNSAGTVNGSDSNSNENKVSDSMYNAILTTRVNSQTCPDLNGDRDKKSNAKLGTFYNQNDCRIETCTVRSVYVNKQNLSYSFDPQTFLCQSCTQGHKVAGDQEAGADRAVFVLSDQCFPPVMGSKNGTNCIKIIRIENGKLFELARAFVDLMTGVCVPVGSVVLISSATQLAEYGMAAYAEELARSIRYLMSTFQNRIDVKHGVSIPLAGCEAGRVIRSLAELDAWLSSLPDMENFPAGARHAALLALKNAGTGQQPIWEQRLRLPKSLQSFEKITWHSSGWADLPLTVAPLDAVAEKDILETLISELNNNYSLNLDRDIMLARNPAQAEVVAPTVPTIVVIGHSNAARLAALLTEAGANVHHITVPSWQPNATSTATACEELRKIEFVDKSSSIIVFYNLDSSAYRAATLDGDNPQLVPARQLNGGGSYHLEGELVITPKEIFQKILKVCLPLLQLHPDVQKLILSPSPRYWLTKCCEEPSHIPNFSQPEYEDEMFTGLANLRRVIKDFYFMQHITNLRVMNPFLVFADVSGRTIPQEAIDAVRDIWGPDPVHPSLDCMDKLATKVMTIACGEENPTETASTASVAPKTAPPCKRLKWASETPSPFVTPHTSRGRGHGLRGWGDPGGRGRGRGYGFTRGHRGHRGWRR
jgi:hypothetical protein